MRLHPDDYADNRRNTDALTAARLTLSQRLCIALASVWVAGFIILATLAGIERSNAMPSLCDGMTRSDCRALLAEGGAS